MAESKGFSGLGEGLVAGGGSQGNNQLRPC